ncbi:MFS transporter [Rhizobium sp. DKSPLA3]|uniref:MFS transporter n=1 Tax=Rhizobium quercicola TaxID=2901226 RepID=A0A9X1T1A2_9HYPH|nr:MFS transporter [Rhizobium quercicola]MCD7109555.1 MFS transporter [Rhizobium quercicola]
MQRADDGGTRTETQGLSRNTTLIFAAAAGLSVANIYYAQPLLDAMARDFAMSPSAIGLVVTLTQIGYALGLIFLVPLGDLIDRRRLILAQGMLSVAALVALATARTEAILFASLAAMGLLAVVVQVLVAFAATLATPAERGKAVGRVTSGVVIGILAARFIAGALADLGGWRAVYLTSAVLTTAMLGLLMRVLPRRSSPDSTDSYAATLRSMPRLFLRDRIVLVRGLLAFLIFATFSTFWTALVLPLSTPPFSYSHTQIGLFGLVGMAGAAAATGAGRLSDRGLGAWTTGLSLALLLASWALIARLQTSLPLFLAGVVLLDLCVQAVHVTNQSVLLARHPQASSRIVGGYMVFYAIGSAVGAITSTIAYAQGGWRGVSMLGAGYSATGLLVWGTATALSVGRTGAKTRAQPACRARPWRRVPRRRDAPPGGGRRPARVDRRRCH